MCSSLTRWMGRFFETRAGWQMLKLAGIMGVNPVKGEGRMPERFGQIFASCQKLPAAEQGT